MIGVIADYADERVVQEFFELFKTPWEFYRKDRDYEVVLCSNQQTFKGHAKVLIYYSGRKCDFDEQQKIECGRERQGPRILKYREARIPIYKDTVAFSNELEKLLEDEQTHECAAFFRFDDGLTVVRIGYDLFKEIRTVLEDGQPVSNAALPALDLQIELLRNIIVGSGVSLVEIPPVPEGYSFIACLTHDVDHPMIRRHKLDHTMFGFLYRAIFGSVVKWVHGKLLLRDLFTNWAAALRLPFVYFGLAKDFWSEFADMYLTMENGHRSTFFVIPFKCNPGQTADGPAPKYRASNYAAKEIGDSVRKLRKAGCEIGSHGIDAWLDSTRGRAELEEIRRLSQVTEIGARMHWLYFGADSPATLDKAGASYDSSVGYNQTIGYRAGTTQAYKPLMTSRLLELPLHIMDTALFYPSHLGLSTAQAKARMWELIDHAARQGGCLTINWHDRSVAPERLWGQCYRDLLKELIDRGAWLSTAGDAAAWFRKRRSAVFEAHTDARKGWNAMVGHETEDRVPGLRLRIHTPQNAVTGAEEYRDHPVSQMAGSGMTSKSAG